VKNVLVEKIRSPDTPVIFYELIPPAKGADESVTHAYAECAAELVADCSTSIDAINLPEIRTERREAERTHPYEPKTDQREFARQFKATFGNTVELVVNRCTVYEEWEVQQTWLEETNETFGIQNIILVGGESSKVRYPGPSVTEMACSIHYVYGKTFFCGGITIPTRRHRNPSKDEAHRLLHKGRHGLEYFTSQVLYEPQGIQQLLLDYDRLCKAQGEPAKRILLSFAPVSSRKDLSFLRWLGVYVPKDVESTLLKANIGIGWRSLKTACQILNHILAFVEEHQIDVPLGLNVEHITRQNFELSKQFIEELGVHYQQT